jgi:hypothetical protein
VAVNHPDRGSSPLRDAFGIVAERLMQRIVNPCFGNGGSNPLNLRRGHSIIGNAFDLGSKDCRFESCCPEK